MWRQHHASEKHRIDTSIAMHAACHEKDNASEAMHPSSHARGAGLAGPQDGAPRGQEQSDWGAYFTQVLS
jgi:hypothetical protein